MTNFLRSAALLCGLALLSACDKNAVQTITAPAEGARVKFFNFGLNAPAVNFYANDAKVTAITSATGTESTNGVAYGSAGNAGLYNMLGPGQYTFSGRIAAATDKDLIVSRVTGAVESGKAYSVYLSGSYDATAKSVEGFLIEDAYPAAFDYAQAYVRFVNAISNSAPTALVLRNTTTATDVPIGTAVAYKGGTAFVVLPAGTYDLGARVGGAATNSYSRTGVAIVQGRVYTITARGDITITSTTATNRPFLDVTPNR